MTEDKNDIHKCWPNWVTYTIFYIYLQLLLAIEVHKEANPEDNSLSCTNNKDKFLYFTQGYIYQKWTEFMKLVHRIKVHTGQKPSLKFMTFWYNRSPLTISRIYTEHIIKKLDKLAHRLLFYYNSVCVLDSFVVCFRLTDRWIYFVRWKTQMYVYLPKITVWERQK